MTVSLFLLGILLSVYAAFYQRESYDEQALRLVTRHRVSFWVALPEYYGERIRAVEGVEEVCIFNWFGGVLTRISNLIQTSRPSGGLERRYS